MNDINLDISVQSWAIGSFHLFTSETSKFTLLNIHMLLCVITIFFLPPSYLSYSSDKSIPQLSAIETETSELHHNLLDKMIDEQAEYESLVCDTAREGIEHAGYPNAQTESKPPNPKEMFSPARLLLSHLGYLSLDALKVSS